MNPESYHLKIGGGRRIVLPSDLCRNLSLDVGDTVIVRLEDDQATLRSVDRTISRFQSLLAQRVPPGTSLVNELIAEREDEAARE